MTKDEIHKEALEETLKYNRCTAALGTGVGKTKFGLEYLKAKFREPVRLLIVAPKLSVLKEWRSEAEKFKLDEFICLSDSTTYLSLNKHDPDDYDFVILDECHSLLASHSAFLSKFKGGILGLTGTPPVRHYSEKAKMVNRYCPVVYKYLVDQAVEDNILNDYQIIVHELELSTRKDFQVSFKNKPGFMTSEKLNYQYWTQRLQDSDRPKDMQMNSIMRMKALMTYGTKELYAKKLIKHLAGKDEKLIIFANTQEQADKLCSHSYHSKNPDSEENLDMFRKGDIKELSCVMQLSEGVNIPDLKQSIILHAYGNERKSSQRIGRMLRLNPNDKSTIHILCYMGTVDEKWVKEALNGFDDSKIIWKNFNISLY
jgi:superfamily II DNA or RNA helicase